MYDQQGRGAKATPGQVRSTSQRDQVPGKTTLTAGLDCLSLSGEASDPAHIDQTAAGGSAATAGGSAATAGGAAAGGAAVAVPINLKQIVTSWTPSASQYGFQLQFECASSSGSVADLQAQPNLLWREYVTYSRNDFAHRITPSNPTILPPGGIAFSAPTTTVLAPNRLDLGGARDTHWMPTSAVRDTDYGGTTGRTLPAIMESSQVYQYTTNGSSWTTFAGPFTLRRTFEHAGAAVGRAAGAIGGALLGGALCGAPGAIVGGIGGAVVGGMAGEAVGAATGGALTFQTNKVGIHSVTEAYKP